jgi:2-polyprenyl-3-methyl-5-hydroxy-6-metoxy-1,4-benzoquinol methylase
MSQLLPHQRYGDIHHRIDIPNGAAYYPQIIWHLMRYKFVRGFVKPTDDVLDIACGTGYGTRLISDYCKSIIGVDNDEETIEYAEKIYGGENRTFKVGEVLEVSGKYDIIICYETIEHISRGDGLKAMQRFKDCLKSNGVLFVSTPKKLPVEECSPNRIESHLYEYDLEEFQALLNKYFERPILFSQTDEIITIGNLKAVWTFIGVCFYGQ